MVEKAFGGSMTPEGRIKAMVNRRLKKEFGDWFYHFMPVQNGMGAPGLDYYCCFFSNFIAIETKKPGGKLTDRQKVTKAAIERAGGTVFVVDGEKALDDMIRHLTA
jgi:hypothetical protein